MKVTTVKNGVETEGTLMEDVLSENHDESYLVNKEYGNFWTYIFCFIFIVVALGLGNMLGKSAQYDKSIDAKIAEYKMLKIEKVNHLSGAFAIQDKLNAIESELDKKGIKLYQNDE